MSIYFYRLDLHCIPPTLLAELGRTRQNIAEYSRKWQKTHFGTVIYFIYNTALINPATI